MNAFQSRIGARLRTLSLAAAVSAAASCASSPAPTPTLEGFPLPVWSEYLVAGPEESAWREIPWIPTLAEGVHAAARAERPVLLWMMNGHPLGCT